MRILFNKGPSCLRHRERHAEARTAAAKAADAPEADASEATDNSELLTAAVNAADVTEAATVKKPTGRRSDGTSEKEHSRSPRVNCPLMLQNSNLSRSPHHREH